MRATIGLLLLVVGAGCSHPPPDSTPEGVLRLFLDEMEQASSDPHLMRAAYELGPAARANLEARARHAAQLQGRQVQPWEMQATGRFGLAFRPKAMRTSVVGDRATVLVLGADPNEQASVVCVREVGGWRVEPGLPEP